jgi:predicted porin
MTKKIIIASFICLTAFASFAQSLKQYVGLNAQIGKPVAVSAYYQVNKHLGKKQKLIIGVGPRFTSAFSSKQNTVTADTRLTTGSVSFGALFSEQQPQFIDTITFNKAQINALNIFVNIGYQVTPKLAIGFNIDAIGLSFGAKQAGVYVEKANLPVTAKPTLLNLLLISDSDLGTLNSELYASYKINPKINLNAGLGFLFAEYTTDTKVQVTNGISNDRFRNKGLGLMLGVKYNLK